MMLYREKQAEARPPGARHPEHSAGWTEERVERARVLWRDGVSAAAIARSLGGGVTRNGVIGKLSRLGLIGDRPAEKPRLSYAGAETAPVASRPKQHGNKNQPKAAGIVARRHKAEDGRLNGKLAHVGSEPFRAGSVIPEETEPGVDVTAIVGISFMEIDSNTCKRAVAGAGSGMRFCGGPPVEGKPYCDHHTARAYHRA